MLIRTRCVLLVAFLAACSSFKPQTGGYNPNSSGSSQTASMTNTATTSETGIAVATAQGGSSTTPTSSMDTNVAGATVVAMGGGGAAGTQLADATAMGGAQTTQGGQGGAPGAATMVEMGGSGGARPEPNVGPPYAFPQNNYSPRCVYPASLHPDHAQAAYDRWNEELVTGDGAGGFLRVRRPAEEEDTTVSEGIAYGMILSVVMGDQDVFDQLWQYSQQHLNQNGLMNWLVSAQGSVEGEGAATDADQDMAWALIMADTKWAGGGSLGRSYMDLAREMIQKIWDHEVDHGRGDLILAGDSWGETVAFNPSYFAPNQYRLFGRITGNEADWNRVVDRGYQALNASLRDEFGNAQNGLAPAWTDENGTPSQVFEGAPTHYQYDSARIPFRIGQDYCEYGDERAKAYLAKTSNFFSGLGAEQVVDGYNLDGSPRPDNPGEGVQSALFVGAAGVGAMSDPAYQAFVDDTYSLLITKEMYPRSYYFNLCWQVFSLLQMTGNLFDYTLHP